MEKKMRRVLAGLLAAIMVFSLFVTVVATEDGTGGDAQNQEMELQTLADPYEGQEAASGEDQEGEAPDEEEEEPAQEEPEPDTEQGTSDQTQETGGEDPQPAPEENQGEPETGAQDPEPVENGTKEQTEAGTAPQEAEETPDQNDPLQKQPDTWDQGEQEPTDTQADREAVDWSGVKNRVRFALDEIQEQEDQSWRMTLQLRLTQDDPEQPICAGDTASVELPEEWLTAQDTKDPVDLLLYRETGEDQETALNVKIGTYTIRDGEVKITFTQEVESQELDLTQAYGKLTFAIQWAEQVRKAQDQEASWVLQTYGDQSKNEVTFTVPAREAQDWTEVQKGVQIRVAGLDPETEEQALLLELGFQEEVVRSGLKEGDTLSFALPILWMQVEDCSATPFFAQAGQEGAEIQVGTYEIREGQVTLTFTEKVADQQVQDHLKDLTGRLSIGFQWQEGCQTQEEQSLAWVLRTWADGTEDEGQLTIPALEQVDQGLPEEEPETEETPQQPQQEEPAEEPAEETEAEPQDLPAIMAVNDLTVGEWTWTNVKYTENGSRDIYWIDNNNGDNIRPKLSNDLVNQGNLTFSATMSYQANGQTVTETVTGLTAEQMGATGLTYQLTNLGGTGHWILAVGNLPATATIERDGESYNATFSDWKVVQDTTQGGIASVADNYVLLNVTQQADGSYQDQNGVNRPGAQGEGWYFVQKMDFQITIEIRRGTDAFDKASLLEAIDNAYSFFWKTGINGADGQDINSGSIALNGDEFEKETTQIGSEDEVPPKAVYTIKNVEKYNLDGSELIFYVDQNGGGNNSKVITSIRTSDGTDQLLDGDYLAESIENDPVSNFGTNTTEVYNGGKLILTRTGYTDYTATKEWHDTADSSERPKVEFYLWRFTLKEDTEKDLTTAYQTAAPVKATDGAGAGQNAVFTIPEHSSGDEQIITFDSAFTIPEGEAGHLPKYDPEGYPYVYLTREYMSGAGVDKYRTEYGALQADGTFQDTLIYSGDRSAQDNSVYNDGTISNVLTGTTSASVTKNWIANAFQSELADVEVELTLFSRPKGADEDAWEPTSQVYRMGEETPFIAEFLSQSHSITVQKYSNAGAELEFCWRETGIYQAGSDANLLLPDGSFTLTQKGQGVVYTSQSVITEENGTYHTEITNQIEDKTAYYLRKTWADEISEEQRGTVELLIYRTGADNVRQKLQLEDGGNFKLDGTVDAEPVNLYYVDDAGTKTLAGQVQETEAWFAAFTELERYDPDGSMYDYIAFEGSHPNWTPQYSTEVDEETGAVIHVIHNLPGPGASQSILLRKRWLDDGDEQHRGDVTFTIYQIPEDADSITQELLKEPGVEVKTATLTRAQDWWMQVYLDVSVNLDQLLVLETSLTGTDANGGPFVLNYTEDQLNQIFALQHGQDTASPAISYETYYHRYEATYSMVTFEGNQFYTVTNRRLGNIDIEVTKNWVDGSGTGVSEERREFLKAIKDAGYELVFYLVPNAAGVTIDYDKNAVTMGSETVPIRDKNGDLVSAIQTIDTQNNTSVYYFYNLPKYDLNGHLVGYTVKEMLRPIGAVGNQGVTDISTVLKVEDITTDYTFSIIQSGYTVQHGLGKHDLQTFTATNRLSGTKEVFFWKEWNDTYRFQQGERPDLYLDLYRVTHNANGSENAAESVYLDRRWQFRDDTISLCDFGSMSKYDQYGYEIIYYAQERILVNAAAFDYIPVYYKYDARLEDKGLLTSSLDGTDPQENLNQIIKGLSKMGDETGYVGQDDGITLYNHNGVYLLKEYGVFVNQIQADVVVSGKKIWANIPAGFLEADLAPVTFRLYQYNTAKGDTVPGDNEDVAADGTLAGKASIATLEISDWVHQKYNNNYNFALQYQGANTNTVNQTDGTITVGVDGTGESKTLPKYDEEGNLYTYVLRESGEFALDQDDAVKNGYVFKQPVINNFAITNTYAPRVGVIQVKKLLENIPTGSKGPAVSFTLTREYETANGLQKDTVFSQTQIIDYDAFVKGTATIQFTNLPIYAPNGSKYVYTVEENGEDSQLIQGGFAAYGGVGDLNSGDLTAAYQEGEKYLVTGLSPKYEDSSLLGTIAAFFQPIVDFFAGEPDTSWATFKNVYQTEPVPLYFAKAWTDYNNSANARLKTLTFTVSRSADAQPGQGNAIGSQALGSMTLTLPADAFDKSQVELTPGDGIVFTEKATLADWVSQVTVMTTEAATGASSTSTLGDTGTWVFKVEFVEDFAPNGMPWKYLIKEDTANIAPYTATTSSTTVTYDATSQSFATPTTAGSYKIVNSILTSVTFWKNWRYQDAVNQKFNNPFGMNMVVTTDVYAAAVAVTNPNQYPGDDAFNDAALWKKLADQSDLLKLYQNWPSSLSPVISYGASSQLGVKDGASSISCSNLPNVLYDSATGTWYYMKYYLIESDFSLKSGGKIVYQETFIPTFKLYDTTGKGYPGTSRVGFWLNGTAEVWNGTAMEATNLLLVTSAVDSEQKLDAIHRDGLGAVLDTTLSLTTDRATYPFVNFYDKGAKHEATGINMLDFTQLEVTKTWAEDQDNIYGTRDPQGTGWKVEFQIQRKDKASLADDWENVSTVTVSNGNNKVPTETATVTKLMTSGLVELSNGGYKVVEFQYRARELDGSQVVEQTGDTYRGSYQVAYKDEGDNKNGYTVSATNTLQHMDIRAEKTWVGEVTDEVIFELQYQKEDGTWTSFATKAQVTLTGTADPDATKAYREYAAWKAEWKGVPKVMPDSTVDANGQTNYRVVEITNNAYVTTEDVSGLGTGQYPYVLPDNGTEGFENELTQLKVEKVVEKYVAGATSDEVFTLQLTGPRYYGTIRYQKYTKSADGTGDQKVGSLTELPADGQFTLKDNQYVIFYGLCNRAYYTVTETDSQGYTPQYQVTKPDGTQEAPTTTSGQVQIPTFKPITTPSILVTNQRFGSLTVLKEDEEGKALAGVTFLLEKKKANEDDTHWTEVELKTTDATGQVTFTDLELDYDYQVTETAVPAGYNKLANPVKVHLPYDLDTGTSPAGSTPLYTDISGKDYFAEITITIGNNQALVMPTTAGSGFFWPGLLGPVIAALGAGGCFLMNRSKSARRRRRPSAPHA